MCLICHGMSRRDFYGLVRSRILEFGFTLVHVDGDGPANPPYTYTVGLSGRDHPELIAFAMHEECASHALEPVARSVLQETQDARSSSHAPPLAGMGEVMMATPAITDKMLILRGQHHVFAIKNK